MATVHLPDFLEPLNQQLPGEPSTEPVNYQSALFRHCGLPSVAHALWWPSQNDSSTCMIFIPGNPGLLDWYTPFLSAIHEKSGKRLNIVAHAFVGHTPGIDIDHTDYSVASLPAQVEHVLELFDIVKRNYERVVVVGHSVGSWVTTQVMKYRENGVDAAFLLFPTICDIADTPNGRRLSSLFASPLPRAIAWLAKLTFIIPDRVLAMLYGDWPVAQRAVLRSLISSPTTVFNCLTMAHEEMMTIKGLDEDLLRRNKERLHVYFADQDHWVGEQMWEVLRVLGSEEETVKVVHGEPGIPHSFCINHGETLAEQCTRWLAEGGYI